jgi:DNA-binding NarL/FixJ family response regulator
MDKPPETPAAAEGVEILTAPRLFTPRELEIVRLMALGFSYKQIADFLRISQRTVEAHLFRCRHKLGAKNSCELVYMACKAGQIE